MYNFSNHTDELREKILLKAGVEFNPAKIENELTEKLRSNLKATRESKQQLISLLEKGREKRTEILNYPLLACLFVCTFSFFAVVGQSNNKERQKYATLELNQKVKLVREDPVKKKH